MGKSSLHMSEYVPMFFTTMLEQIRDQARPACLMACADTCAIVSMEIFIEQDQIAPVWIALKFLDSTMDSTTPLIIAQENPHQAQGYFVSYLFQRQKIT